MAVQAQLYPESPSPPLFGLQDSVLEPNFGFPFQESPQHQNLFLHQQSCQNIGFDYCNTSAGASSSSSQSTCDSFLSMPFSHQSLNAYHLEMHRQEEVDCILQLRNQRLRSALQEQRKQQLSILLKSVESNAMSLMRQKEEDLAQATKTSMELETCLRKAQTEIEAWQRLARENESMVIDLSNTLEQASNRGQEDTESFCYGSCKKEEQEYQQQDSQKKIACKGCSSRVSCVLFLPCRHLCSCKFCEAFLVSCPVCDSVKEGSMEVFWV